MAALPFRLLLVSADPLIQRQNARADKPTGSTPQLSRLFRTRAQARSSFNRFACL